MTKVEEANGTMNNLEIILASMGKKHIDSTEPFCLVEEKEDILKETPNEELASFILDDDEKEKIPYTTIGALLAFKERLKKKAATDEGVKIEHADAMIILKASQNDFNSVREVASEILEYLPVPEATLALLIRVSIVEHDPDVREAAKKALISRGKKGVL